MVVTTSALFFAGLFTSAYACGDAVAHSRRASMPSSITLPTRPLEWGDINIIHTTDSHGWLLGHQKASSPEPNYSGDFGDFASFVAHMKEMAEKRNADLLLVDSGDLHDGTGLIDGFPPGGIDAHDANEFFTQLPYDVLAIGNHELYKYVNALDMHQNFAPKFPGRYLTSNVNITVADKQGNPVNIPLGSRYAKFKTRKGRKVTALGVLFDFTGFDKNTTVQKVADMVKEQWFAEAIEDEPDFFLLAGHMPVAQDKWPLVFNAIRQVHPSTPILILGGHSHIRDCIQLDGRSMSLESGRYMETIAAKLDHGNNSSDNITFTRRYLDPNRVTYEYHTGRKGSSFDTRKGKSITSGLKALAKAFNLDFLFGTAPRDFTLNRVPYPSESSLLSLFIEDAVPTALAINNTRSSIPNLIITNSGSQRFDIYAGPFTKNDQLTTSPFADAFFYIPEITLSLAKQVLLNLNHAGATSRRSSETLEAREAHLYGLGYVDKRYREWLESMDKRNGAERREAANQTLGYVTQDVRFSL
ncbi:hypothetical protein H0H81_009128 [Sphagnurus paluster]|uniref:Calcineurin-like phosphoesterase domain-containing protein n=1 Tax=Sphagnurus paluster TaxID=117069 RepID=A0A9P7GMM9_9AGAR|nr:hypothetical protein H0H81_009128 [Sphagnurus paluster]